MKWNVAEDVNFCCEKINDPNRTLLIFIELRAFTYETLSFFFLEEDSSNLS